jgi:hypothetical protein
MGIISFDRYAPLETALKRMGFKMDEVEKQGKRTVITVSRCGQSDNPPVFPALKLVPMFPEEQGANGR